MFSINYKSVLIVIAVCVLIYAVYLLYQRFSQPKKVETITYDNSNITKEKNNEYIDSEVELPTEIVLKNNPYFEIAIDGKQQGRVIFELFDNELPLTCKNFRQLCAVNILDPESKTPSYSGSIFHRVIKQFMIQGGDFTNYDGTGGLSIYGESFKDESFEYEHNQMGLLSMANRGPDTNGSQFFILLESAPHLNNKHVVFGMILTGFDIIKKIEDVECDSNDKPLVRCEIVESGIMK